MAELHLLSPAGFRASGVYAGIKSKQTPDVGLLICDNLATAAAAEPADRPDPGVRGAPVRMDQAAAARPPGAVSRLGTQRLGLCVERDVLELMPGVVAQKARRRGPGRMSGENPCAHADPKACGGGGPNPKTGVSQCQNGSLSPSGGRSSALVAKRWVIQRPHFGLLDFVISSVILRRRVAGG